MVSVQCLIIWLHTLSSVLCLSTRLYRLQPSIQTPSAACIPPSQVLASSTSIKSSLVSRAALSQSLASSTSKSIVPMSARMHPGRYARPYHPWRSLPPSHHPLSSSLWIPESLLVIAINLNLFTVSFLSKSIQIHALPSLATSHPSVSPTTSTHSLLQIPHPCQDYIPQSRFVYQLPPCRIYFDPILVPDIASLYFMIWCIEYKYEEISRMLDYILSVCNNVIFKINI